MEKRKKRNGQQEEMETSSPNYQEAVQALARMTYKSIYIIDHQKKVFDYVSDNPLFLCGYSAQEVQKMGFDFYTQCIPDSDQNTLIKIMKAGFNFLQAIPIEERIQYTLACDFHLKHRRIPVFLIHHELTPLCLTKTGELWKSICIVSLSTAHHIANSKIFKRNSASTWTYNLKHNTWKPEIKPKLSLRELEILQYSIRGYQIQEIASCLYLTCDTIKFHRKKILEKLQVHTIAEAIRFAIVNKLL
ncbi:MULTISPECIES: response regulator transcription factor [unclassified Myroides]|uniref:response regulator transcription factor n=1 Tax=unclassified Myroides TaxID=2642485 RepID=UPI003D2F82FD